MPTPLFPAARSVLLGVVHLPPLPGAPGWRPGAAGARRPAPAWLARARSDARTYLDAGFDGVIVENFGDAPFHARRVPNETVAALAVAARAVREDLPPSFAVGLNVLRNDGPAAVAIAAAADLGFVRINVLAGATVTDQGLIEGEAARVARDRARLAPDVQVLADVRVKHGAPLAVRPLEDEAYDLATRAGADALILTGSRTGVGVDEEELRTLKRHLPDTPVLVGSGATRASVARLLLDADGVIVGTAVKQGGNTEAPVDRRRATAFVAAARG